jgi:hypothetical protein
MGTGASVGKSGQKSEIHVCKQGRRGAKGYDNSLLEDEEAETSVSLALSPRDAILSVDIIPFNISFSKPISQLQMSQCRDTLSLILHPQADCTEGSRAYVDFTCRQNNFFVLFWAQLASADVENEISPRFEPTAASLLNPSVKIPDKNVILVRLLKFFTSCSPQKFVNRSRRLGRAHARIGIEERHLQTFGESLVRSLAYTLGSEASNSIMSMWADLIMFTIQQMIVSPASAHSSAGGQRRGSFNRQPEDQPRMSAIEEVDEDTSEHGLNSPLNYPRKVLPELSLQSFSTSSSTDSYLRRGTRDGVVIAFDGKTASAMSSYLSIPGGLTTLT